MDKAVSLSVDHYWSLIFSMQQFYLVLNYMITSAHCHVPTDSSMSGSLSAW